MKRTQSTHSISGLNRLKVRAVLAERDENFVSLARHLGISKQYLSDMLRARKNAAAYAPRIAAYLGVPLTAVVLSAAPSSSSPIVASHFSNGSAYAG